MNTLYYVRGFTLNYSPSIAFLVSICATMVFLNFFSILHSGKPIIKDQIVSFHTNLTMSTMYQLTMLQFLCLYYSPLLDWDNPWQLQLVSIITWDRRLSKWKKIPCTRIVCKRWKIGRWLIAPCWNKGCVTLWPYHLLFKIS